MQAMLPVKVINAMTVNQFYVQLFGQKLAYPLWIGMLLYG